MCVCLRMCLCVCAYFLLNQLINFFPEIIQINKKISEA